VNRAPLAAFCVIVLAFPGAADAQAPAQDRMTAIVYHRYGPPDVLRLDAVPKPVPGDDEVLVRVRAASVNPLDWHLLEGTPYILRLLGFGLLEPKNGRLGVDFAGTVEAVGKQVTTLKPGDEVFGGRNGALAEYITVRAQAAVVKKPTALSFEQAASVPIAAVTALQALRDAGKVRAGQKVLINGASGGVGTFAVQLAKSFGAEVTGVCSTRNVELVRSLGADEVIDYTREDFTQAGRRYDLVVDNVGNHSLFANRRALSPSGRYILIGGGGLAENRWIGSVTRPVRALLLSRFVSQDMRGMLADLNQPDLALLGDLIAAGKIRPVIDRRYPLREAPQAMRYLEAGHARGKVILTVEPGGAPTAAGSASESAGRGWLVACVFGGILAGVAIFPILASLLLNRRFRRRNPANRPYRWGYYFSIQSVAAGLGLGILLESVIACGLLYAVLAWSFARRRRWAWLTLTILSFNPLVWIINGVYLKKRWAEAQA
jgi:NADPH:quinone reductase-like Zn-dependent oxidoreductase